MTNGLGTGLFALMVLAVLVGLAVLLGLALAAVVVARRSTGAVPGPLRYVPVALLLAVLVAGGFGVLVLYDEDALLAWLIGALVPLPLFAVGLDQYRRNPTGTVATVATAGLAWWLPFVVGLAVTVGVVNGASSVVGLTPPEVRRFRVAWIAGAVGGAVVLAGSVVLGRRLRQNLFERTTA